MQELTRGEVMPLRRLLGWVACEIGQTPDELVATVRNIVPKIGEVSEEGKARLVQAHQESCNVPKYVRDAVRALHIAIDFAPASNADCTRCLHTAERRCSDGRKTQCARCGLTPEISGAKHPIDCPVIGLEQQE